MLSSLAVRIHTVTSIDSSPSEEVNHYRPSLTVYRLTYTTVHCPRRRSLLFSGLYGAPPRPLPLFAANLIRLGLSHQPRFPFRAKLKTLPTIMAGTSSPTPGSSHSPTSPNAHAHAHFQRDSLNSNGHSDDGSLFSHLPTIDASDLNITDRDRSSQTPRSKIGTSGASFERNNDFDWDEWEKAMENQTKGWNEENRPEENAFQEVMRKKEDDQEEDAEEIWLDALDQQENVQSQQSTEQDEKENAEFTIGELEVS